MTTTRMAFPQNRLSSFIAFAWIACITAGASRGADDQVNLAREVEQFQAGAAAVDVTPLEFPVIVNGMFTERTATLAHDRLMARSLVLDDGLTRLAIVIVDNLMIPRDLADEAKAIASRATEIPVTRMLIAATHTHSAPSAMGCLGSRADPKYRDFLSGQIAKSIVLANHRLRPARAGWTVVQDYEHNHCRRWIFRSDRMGTDPFGVPNVRAMMHPGHQSQNHIGPSGPVDPDLSILAIQSAQGEPIAALANYALHYKGSPLLSGDFCGRFSDALASELAADGAGREHPFVGLMSQGTSGDSMWMDYAQPRNDPGLDAYTTAMAKQVAEAWQRITFNDHVSLAMAEEELRLQRRVPDQQRLDASRTTVERLGNRLPTDRGAIYAMEAVYLHEQPEVELKLQAIRVGGMGLTAIPNEVYGITGRRLKMLSPLQPTLNIELANGAEGYIPPPEQHHLGGYTTWPARTAGLEVEAEPKIVRTLLRLLAKVAETAPQADPDRDPVPAAPAGLVPEDDYVRAIWDAKPIAYWPLDDLSGQVARDISEHENHGRYATGIAFYLPGRGPDGLVNAERTPTRAVHFAGGHMRAEVEVPADAYSVELWFWNGLPTDVRPVAGYLVSIVDSTKNTVEGDHVAIRGGSGEGTGTLLFDNGAGTTLHGTTRLRRQGWHHLCLVRDGQSVNLYLDGRTDPEVRGTANVRRLDRRQIWFAGGGNDNATLEGKLDDIAVFDRPLTSAEVQRHYQAAGLKSPLP